MGEWPDEKETKGQCYLVRLASEHPVLDAVLVDDRTKKRKAYFIQVSMSQYSNHKKFVDLETTNLRQGDPDTVADFLGLNYSIRHLFMFMQLPNMIPDLEINMFIFLMHEISSTKDSRSLKTINLKIKYHTTQSIKYFCIASCCCITSYSVLILVYFLMHEISSVSNHKKKFILCNFWSNSNFTYKQTSIFITTLERGSTWARISLFIKVR